MKIALVLLLLSSFNLLIYADDFDDFDDFEDEVAIKKCKYWVHVYNSCRS